MVFDGGGVQGVLEEQGGEEFFDAAVWTGWRVDLGGGGGGDQVEVFGGGGADGVDPELWWDGLPGVFGVSVSGGAGEVQHGAVRVWPHPPLRVVFEEVMPPAVGVGVVRGGFSAVFGVLVVNVSRWSSSQRQTGCRQDGNRQVSTRAAIWSRWSCRGR